jgi:hypothetical protein
MCDESEDSVGQQRAAGRGREHPARQGTTEGMSEGEAKFTWTEGRAPRRRRQRQAPRDEAAACPRALRDPELAHERRALERRLGVAPLGGLDECVQEQEGANEPEQREH